MAGEAGNEGSSWLRTLLGTFPPRTAQGCFVPKPSHFARKLLHIVAKPPVSCLRLTCLNFALPFSSSRKGGCEGKKTDSFAEISKPACVAQRQSPGAPVRIRAQALVRQWGTRERPTQGCPLSE